MTGDDVLTPSSMREYSDVPHSAVTRKSQLSTSVPDSLKPANPSGGKRSQWPPYSPAPASAMPAFHPPPPPQTRSEGGTNVNNRKVATATQAPPPPPSTEMESTIAKRRLSQRRKPVGDNFRLYLKDDYLFAAKREYPMSDKLRQLQGLSDQAQYKMMKKERIASQLQHQHKEKENEKEHREPRILRQAQASRKTSRVSTTSHKSQAQKTEPKVKVELAYLSTENEDDRPTDTAAHKGVHFKHEELQRKTSDLHHKASSSTVSTDISTLETPETPPSVYVLPPIHQTPPQPLSQRNLDDGARKSVRTRIAKGLRINPSITR